MDTQKLQALRCIDKFDKLGRNAVVDLLQKSEEEFGANLMPWQAEMIGYFLDCGGDTNQETLDDLKSWLYKAKKVTNRIELILFLDKGDGYTLWDHIIDYPTNDNDHWSLTERPKNIAFTLDDIICALQGRAFSPSSKCTFNALNNLLSRN